MAKVLVIKGANFSTNKVTSVTMGSVPCTGISIDESSINITDYDPVEIEYTVTPVNTTDPISWASSDENVATVENGIVTPVGIGTATITATCGNYSDTIDITVAIEYEGAYIGAVRTRINNDVNPAIVTLGTSSKRATAYGTGSQATTYRAEKTGSVASELKGIKLPKNTAKVRVSRGADKGSLFDNNSNCDIIWTKDEFCGNNTYPNAIKPISSDACNLYTTATNIFTVPSGADSLFVSFVFASAPVDFDATMAESGFTIEFLDE